MLSVQDGLPEDVEAVYVGCLPNEIDGHEQDVRRLPAALLQPKLIVPARLHPTQAADAAAALPILPQEVAQQLQRQFGCFPVFLGAELKENYYKRERCWGLGCL